MSRLFQRLLLFAFLAAPLSASAQPLDPDALFRKANSAADSGAYEDAIALYQQCLEQTREKWGIRHPLFKNSLVGIAECHAKQGDHAKAIAYYRKALDWIVPQYGYKSKPFKDCLGALLAEQVLAGDERQTLLSLFDYLSPENPELCKYWGETLYLALFTYVITSNYAMASRCANKLAEILPFAPTVEKRNFYKLAFSGAVASGNLLEAEAFLQQLRLWETDPALVLQMEAMMASAKGDYDRGLKLNGELMAICQKQYGKKSLQYANAMNDHGTLLAMKGQTDKAVKELENSLQVIDQCIYSGSDFGNTNKLMTLRSLGPLYVKLGEYDKALSRAEEAVSLARLFWGEENREYASSILNRGCVRFESGMVREAALDFVASNNIYYASVLRNFMLMGEDDRHNYWNSISGNSEFLYECCSSLDDGPLNADCYDAALFTKGLLLESSVALQRFILQSGDEEAIALYQELLDRQRSSSGQEIEALEHKLLEKISGFGDYTQKLNVGWKEVRDGLSGDDVAIEFIKFSSREDVYYGALALKADSEYPSFINLSEEKTLASLMTASVNQLYAPGSVSTQLYEAIWKPLESFLKEGCRVFFSPSGVLHQLAIESLPDGGGTLVSERYQVHRLTSTRQLCNARTTRPSDYRSAVLFGGLEYDVDPEKMFEERFAAKEWDGNSPDLSRGVILSMKESSAPSRWYYLPGTLSEVEHISLLMEGKGMDVAVLSGPHGTEEALFGLSGREIPLVHIATHGFFLSSDAQASSAGSVSGLIFSGANHAWMGEPVQGSGADGIVSSDELGALDLSGTDLVVLSACESGLGELHGEDFFGLQRGFKQAGVKTLLMSLNLVDDTATDYMMTQFYSYLLAGHSKRDAFMLAQNATREAFPQPKYWASFIMLDD